MLAELSNVSKSYLQDKVPGKKGEKIPETNLASSLETQRQAYYLWDLIHTILPEAHKIPEYNILHDQLKKEFLDEGIPIVNQLIQQSIDGQPYSLTGTELTQ